MQATIADNRELAPGCFKMTLSGVGPICRGEPGQFVMVRGDWGTDPLLPRPLSIYRFKGENDQIEIVIRVVGTGTKRLSEMKANDRVELIGPLGTPFPRPEGKKRVILTAGALGIAPLMALAEVIPDGRALLIIGGKAKEDVIFFEQDAQRIRVETVCMTEDGSFGGRGTAISALSSRVRRDDIVYGCGPKGMLKEIGRLSGSIGFRALVSLEERMACGIGVCLGCAVKGVHGHYMHVCKDGPVFDAKDIAWDEV